MFKPTPPDITIAVTVYNRADYIHQAVASALGQSLSAGHQVMVVEDCGPNAAIRESIVREFGDRITYHRNPKTRGLFDNWNACMELCSTRWLCILHDDDFLEPTFLEAMMELSSARPGYGLYYGACRTVNADGLPVTNPRQPVNFELTELPLNEWARYDPVCFPGQLFDVNLARELGGFRATSGYCGDWEMWFKLALARGAAKTNRIVANYREHISYGRGTTKVDVSGRKYAYVNMQRKRNFALLRRTVPTSHFDRVALQKAEPIPTRFILQHAYSFSPRMLRYNARLLLLSGAPHISYKMFQLLIATIGWRCLKQLSKVFNLINH